jgi:hypothetical protein
MNVYSVVFDKIIDNDKSCPETDRVSVLAKDASAAIKKAAAHVMAEKLDWDDDDGKRRTSRVTKFTLQEVVLKIGDVLV